MADSPHALAATLAQLAGTARTAEALAAEALTLVCPAFGADGGEIMLGVAGTHGVRVARQGRSGPHRLEVPLFARGEPVAILALFAAEPFALEAGPRAAEVASPLGPALALLASRAPDPERSGFELQTLQRVAELVARSLDLDEVLGRCLDLALEVAGTAHGSLYVRDEHRPFYRLVHVRELTGPQRPETLPAEQADQFLTVSPAYLDESPQHLTELGVTHPSVLAAVEQGFTRVIVIPLRMEKRVVGLLNVLWRGAATLAPPTLFTLLAIARHLATFIETARAHQRAELRARLATTLREFAERALSCHSLPELHEHTLTTLESVMRADRSLIAEAHNMEGRVMAGHGKDARLVGLTLRLDAPYVRDALAREGPLVVEDTATLDPKTEIGAIAKVNNTASFAFLATRRAGRHTGFLFAGTAEPTRWQPEEVEAMRLLGVMVGEAVDRVGLEAMREAERKQLDAVLEHLPVVVAVLGPGGALLHLNAAAREFGASMGHHGLPWDQAMATIRVETPDGRVLPMEEQGQVRAFRGEQPPPTELVLVRPDGSRITVMSVAAPVAYDADGRVTQVVTGFQDVSALRALADEKDRFLRVASHELRSPITSLRATTSLLEMDPNAITDPERRGLLLQRIQRQVDRLTKLVEQLIDSARLNSDVGLHPSECDLVELVKNGVEIAVTGDAQPGAAARVILRHPPELRGTWDPLRLEQVVINLVGNALRYSAAETPVDVTLEGDGERVRLSVTDRGIGIAPNQRERVFTPFYRGEDATRRHRGGLGLGLFISAEIVRKHGGTLSIDSRPAPDPAHGSTFRVDLPRVTPARG